VEVGSCLLYCARRCGGLYAGICHDIKALALSIEKPCSSQVLFLGHITFAIDFNEISKILT